MSDDGARRLGVVAVTGGPAEGKTTVVEILAQQGIRTASADTVAAGLWEDEDWVALVGDALGLEGPVTKASVRACITADPEARRTLNALSHPVIVNRLAELEAEVVEVPLLVESVLLDGFAQVWVVTCGREEQVRRLAARLGGEERAEALVASQLATRAKLAFADEVIRTNLPMPDVISSVHAAWERGGGLR